MAKAAANYYSGWMRNADGITATLVRGEETRVVTMGQGDGPLVGLSQIVKKCDDEGWRIAALSTPTTILRDLQGSREKLNESYEDIEFPGRQVDFPELFFLGRVKRPDLWDGPVRRQIANDFREDHRIHRSNRNAA